ncbi:MAG: SLC13 family permease, partial [Promethearchaeota archaeon]
MIIPVAVLIIVFVLIVVRKVGNIKLQIWQIMLFGAIAVLVTGQISIFDALLSINLDVMLFLFGMFVVGTALEDSGYLQHLTQRLFRRAKSPELLLLLLLFGFGFVSAFLMNDTVAIIGTPVAILLAKKHNLPARIPLLALAFAVTIGSVMSPIGNPQNLLIAINGGIINPFITFFSYLLIPTILNLGLAFLLLRIFYRKDFQNYTFPADPNSEPLKDQKLAFLSKISLVLILSLIIVKIVIVFLMLPIDFKLTYIALISALPILLFSSKRVE